MKEPADDPHFPATRAWRRAGRLCVAAAMPFLTMCGKEPSAPMKECAGWQPPYVEQVREVGVALAEYHTAWGTDTAPYPSDIRQLGTMGITDHLEQLLSLRPEHCGEWLYFSAADAENGEAPLLVSPPLPHEGEAPVRILLTTSGAVSVKTEEETAAVIRDSPVPPDPVPPGTGDGK